MTLPLENRLKNILGQQPVRCVRLTGGCVADVYCADFGDGERFVVKVGLAGDVLAQEGEMLKYLSAHSTLPVPKVFYNSDDLLVMDYIEGGDPITTVAQEHAADLLAALHNVTMSSFGFQNHTVIGGLQQPNPWTQDWVEFFREQRLLYMAVQAVKSGHLAQSLLVRIEELSTHLDRWLSAPAQASLIHGDMWSGNVLCKENRIAGLVDPAIYYGDPEIELAFSTLFHTFQEPFFSRYQEHRPLSPGFFEERRYIYNLYPLLVHLRLFGGSYVKNVEAILTRFGF